MVALGQITGEADDGSVSWSLAVAGPQVSRWRSSPGR